MMICLMIKALKQLIKIMKKGTKQLLLIHKKLEQKAYLMKNLC